MPAYVNEYILVNTGVTQSCCHYNSFQHSKEFHKLTSVYILRLLCYDLMRSHGTSQSLQRHQLERWYNVPQRRAWTCKVPQSRACNCSVPQRRAWTCKVPQMRVNIYNVPQRRACIYNMPQMMVNTYNVPQRRACIYNMPQRMVNTYNVPQRRACIYNMPQRMVCTYNAPKYVERE